MKPLLRQPIRQSGCQFSRKGGNKEEWNLETPGGPGSYPKKGEKGLLLEAVTREKSAFISELFPWDGAIFADGCVLCRVIEWLVGSLFDRVSIPFGDADDHITGSEQTSLASQT
jgi:hypothetical protein